MEETEEERAARLEALAIAAKEAAIRREEAARERLIERQQHEQVSIDFAAFEPHSTAHEYQKRFTPLDQRAGLFKGRLYYTKWGAMQALTRLNAPKVRTEWRQRMRNAKLVELQAEAERMQARHAHATHIRNIALQVTTPLLAPLPMLISYIMSLACKVSILCSMGLTHEERACCLAYCLGARRGATGG